MLVLVIAMLNLNISQYSLGAIIVAAVFLAIGVIAGFFIGNVSLRKHLYQKVDEQARTGGVQRMIIDNVGLGIIAYNESGVIYANKNVFDFRDFLKAGIPDTMEHFLNTYDKENHLKSSFLLANENPNEVVRANYVVNSKIYEIKIIRSMLFGSDVSVDDDETSLAGSSLTMVIVEDITKIKDDERRQKDLAANVSHELKTPLTVIRASEHFIRSIKKDKMPSYEEISKWGSRILNNAIRMQDIVEDFLVLSMCSQANKTTIFDVNSLISKAITGIVDYPSSANVRFIKPEVKAYPLLYGNDRLILRVVMNLLTNAIKYIEFEGKSEPNEIKVSIDILEDRMAIQVSDNGRGVPKKDLDHLFERFYRVDNSGSREVGGSGLGLAIAKEIADSHDGNITVVSQPLLGSTFTFTLPLASTVFDRVYDDVKAGVVSSIPYYETATKYLVSEAYEAALSRGYADMKQAAQEYEASYKGAGAASANDRKIAIDCLKSLGDERYKDLMSDLLYVDPSILEYGEDEDFYEEDELIQQEEEYYDQAQMEVQNEQNVQEVQQEYSENFQEQPEPATMTVEQLRELEVLEEKKRIREMLSQPVIQISTKYMTDSTRNEPQLVHISQKQAVHIHPKLDKKMYNVSGRNSSVISTDNSALNGDTNKAEEVEKQSAVRKVLDETSPLSTLNKNDDLV
jgi:signal transduction histidine kinase